MIDAYKSGANKTIISKDFHTMNNQSDDFDDMMTARLILANQSNASSEIIVADSNASPSVNVDTAALSKYVSVLESHILSIMNNLANLVTHTNAVKDKLKSYQK